MMTTPNPTPSASKTLFDKLFFGGLFAGHKTELAAIVAMITAGYTYFNGGMTLPELVAAVFAGLGVLGLRSALEAKLTWFDKIWGGGALAEFFSGKKSYISMIGLIASAVVGYVQGDAGLIQTVMVVAGAIGIGGARSAVSKAVGT